MNGLEPSLTLPNGKTLEIRIGTISMLDQDTTEAIAVQNLVKKYGDFSAVNDISFSVMHGEVFGILGPNGAGKTTTLEIIEGLLRPTSGSTKVFGMDSQISSTKVKGAIGVQLQASAYFGYLKLQEMLDLFGRFYPKRVPANRLLDMVGLGDKADSTIGKLSGGQQQRFTIAAALVNDPAIVFLDEPTTGLDPQARRSLWEFIINIRNEGRTVILTTHYMEEAQFLCDRVAIMDHGKIIAEGPPEDLVRDLDVPYEIRFKLDVHAPIEVPDGMFDSLADVQGVSIDEDGSYTLRSTDATDSVSDLLEKAGSLNLRLSSLEVVPGNLEDVFLSLTGHRLRD